ncbi:XK, Kell blood group complex subunit-related family, member 9 [Columba livia]|uniref:XK-related protein n=1 Tax=Columba livia TaxID=8932 RepID=R7VMI8_COLLI|nr:XK-related protein 9 [Columba livia]XP_021142592.1 XK-related protein 9 [Columba livia]XP_021142593.1 XK-related protein 9 [Columba livia]XP_021142594.1 XK-related protein 9 [Columba livia]PKK34192.1 XK, Kell blood group complex subunit-related family, member 9 [Columba livia]
MMKFTKQDFIFLVGGIIIYVVDIGVDFWVASKYFCQGQYSWSILILSFRGLSSLITQVFSYEWFKNDWEGTDTGKLKWIFLVHLFQCGIFIRYWFALKYGCQAAFKQNSGGDASETDPPNFIQKQVIDVVTDINMLRVFKTFLETTPQLFVQIYILMEHSKNNFCQYAAIFMSFCGISISTVDYQVSLRKSLPDKDEFHVLSKLVYLFYKLFTITSWILSISLITLLSVRTSVILLIFLWICGFTWTLKQHTTFCKSMKMEYLYRTVVGIILIFTFFNIKGRKTNYCISIYYATHTVVTLGILLVYMFWKPSVIKGIDFIIVSILTVLSLVLGIIFLAVYYRRFHPTAYCRPQACSDEVDGEAEQKDRVKTSRFQNFIMQ